MNGSAVGLLRAVILASASPSMIDQQLTFADHVRRIIGRCFHSLRQLPSIRRKLTTGTAISLVNALVISRIDYCNTVLAGVYGVHLRQLQGVLNAAARLIVRKQTFDNISSMIRDVLHWLPIQQRIQYKLCTLVSNCLHDVTPVYLPTGLREYRPMQSVRSAARGYIWLFLSQGRCITVRATSLWSDCLHGTLFSRRHARPVINPNILLPPTQDLSFRQSVCFIITLVAVTSVFLC